MVITSSFKPSRQELFKILIARYFKTRWWLYLLIVAYGIFLTFSNYQEQGMYSYIPLIIYVTLFPALICLSLWRQLNSRQNKTMYLERHYEMDFDNIKTFVEDGSSSSIKIENFYKAQRIGNNYIIYLSKIQYYILPVSIFKSDADLKWFEVNVLGKIKTPGFM